MKPDKAQTWNILREIVTEMVEADGVGADDLKRETLLGAELGLTSVDTIHMMIQLEDRLGDDLDLESIVMRDGEYVTDMSMGSLHEALCAQLG